MKSNDIQSAAMIISKLKQHDMNMVPIASTVNRNTNKVYLLKSFYFIKFNLIYLRLNFSNLKFLIQV